jgi:thiol-disulfide isomerase/thioredoxin
MKKITLLFCLLNGLIVFGQTPSYSFVSKELHYISSTDTAIIQKRKNGIDFSEVQFFDLQGKPLEKFAALMKLQDKINTTADYFINDKIEIKTMVVRPSSAEESSAAMFSETPIKEKFIAMPAPNFSVKLINDESFVFDATKNTDLIVLNFWFVSCAPCKAEMPELNKLAEKYKGQQVKFLAITYDDKKAVKKFLTSTKFNYLMGVAAEETNEKFAMSTFPTNIIIDQKGVIIFRETGFVDDIFNMMDKVIAENLKK